VRAGLAGGTAYRTRDRLDRMAVERRQAIAEATANSSWWRRPILAGAARLVELFAPLREAPKHTAMAAFYRIRLAALEIGRRLTARGALDGAADVMFVDRVALVAALRTEGPARDLRPRASAGRARHARHLAERPPDFLRSDGVPVLDERVAQPPRTDGVLCGLGASSGTATGPVRVLRSPDPSAMREGDVLVVAFADPGWTPLFPRAGALVMEVGGLMCHAAVVARELGVPAVFGVPGATDRLQDGQRVRVDGDAGTITPA
ncbi:MAG TPA: PEP-utilizing enzyme, partial [Vicinamibacteria bacterium]|jgi:pyruvate,water dikinase|nr:PEP-utilizing enzyme [Vicinamibacteria bacterium]